MSDPSAKARDRFKFPKPALQLPEMANLKNGPLWTSKVGLDLCPPTTFFREASPQKDNSLDPYFVEALRLGCLQAQAAAIGVHQLPEGNARREVTGPLG